MPSPSPSPSQRRPSSPPRFDAVRGAAQLEDYLYVHGVTPESAGAPLVRLQPDGGAFLSPAALELILDALVGPQ